MTCLILKSDLYKHRQFLRQYLKSISVLSFQINLENIGTLRQAIYRLILKTYFQYLESQATTRCLVPIFIFRSSAGTIRAVPDTVRKVPGLAPVLIFLKPGPF